MTTYDERQVTKTIPLKWNATTEKWEPNTSQGFGSDVNVTNPYLAVEVNSGATDTTKPLTEATFKAEDFASQATLEQIRALLAAEDFASETTLAGVKAVLEAEDFASQATLATRASELTLAALKDRADLLATESTLAALKGRSDLLGTESTLASVLAAVDGLEAKDYATQSTLAAVLAAVDTLESLNTSIKTALEDRLPRNPKQFADGRYRTAGGVVSLSANQSGSIHLANPAGSGVSLTITEFMLAADVACDVNYFKDTTSTGTVREVFVPNRSFEGSVTTKGVLRVGAGVLSGGSQMSPVTRIGANAALTIPYTAVVMPGQSLAVRATAPGGLTGSLLFYGTCTWIEDPLA